MEQIEQIEQIKSKNDKLKERILLLNGGTYDQPEQYVKVIKFLIWSNEQSDGKCGITEKVGLAAIDYTQAFTNKSYQDNVKNKVKDAIEFIFNKFGLNITAPEIKNAALKIEAQDAPMGDNRINKKRREYGQDEFSVAQEELLRQSMDAEYDDYDINTSIDEANSLLKNENNNAEQEFPLPIEEQIEERIINQERHADTPTQKTNHRIVNMPQEVLEALGEEKAKEARIIPQNELVTKSISTASIKSLRINLSEFKKNGTQRQEMEKSGLEMGI